MGSFRRFDTGGVVTTDRYDFKGNAMAVARRFMVDFRRAPDWTSDVELEREVFATASDYDALNRAIAVTAPDASI